MAKCDTCGAQLENSAEVCFSCGVPVKTEAVQTESAPRSRHNCVSKKKTVETSYPDIRGFYEKNMIACASDRAIVFSDLEYLYRIDRNLNLRKCSDYVEAVAQTKDGILTLSSYYNSDAGEDWVLLRYLDDDFNFRSNILLCPLSGYEETTHYIYTLNSKHVFVVQWDFLPDLDRGELCCDFVFRCFDVDTGEETEWYFESIEIEGGRVTYFARESYGFTDDNKIYLRARVYFPENGEDEDCNDENAVITFNFETGEFALLWHDYCDDGVPMFFDFGKGIMWTKPREREVKRRGWTQNINTYHLVPRKIAPKAPILATYPVWENFPAAFPTFTYFDGEKAYYASRYNNLFAVDKTGKLSEDWNGTVYDQGEIILLWQDKIIADLNADHCYMAYPAQFVKPAPDDCIPLE